MTTTEFTEKDLLPLPEPYCNAHEDAGCEYPDMFSAYQLHEYALANVAASRKKLMEQGPVAWVRRHPDGALTAEFLEHAVIEPVRRQSGAWVPLFAAPMPQANESEAVKTLRRVVSNYETNCSVRDAWAWHEDSYNAARAVLAGELGAKNEQSTGKKDLQVEQSKQAQAMDERTPQASGKDAPSDFIVQELILRVRRYEKEERRLNHSEVFYWLNQWKLLAQDFSRALLQRYGNHE